MKKDRFTATLFSTALSLAMFSTVIADGIDWDRAKSLRQKMKSGQSLTDEDSAYLEKAMQARAGNSENEVTRGDGSDEKATVAPVSISEVDSPVKMLTATSSDGNRLEVAYRAPRANRPLPAVVFIHGSLGQRRPHELVDNVKTGPTPTRFLAAGYVVVAATFRTYGESPLSRGPILDAIAIVQEVKKLPEVDPESVVIFGGSGGGSIALELAGEVAAAPVAVVAGEPASVLFTGVMTAISNRESSMTDFATLYTDERRGITEQKIEAISCPVLIHHGDTHPLKRINFELVFPAIQKAGKKIVIRKYPGEDHGFYWGNRTTKETVDQVVKSSIEFIEPLMKSKPAGR